MSRERRPRSSSSASAKAASILEREAAGYDFAQAIRLLMRMYPDRAPVGGWENPSDEIVRFTVPPSFAFPTSEVALLTLPDQAKGRPARLAVRFIGLTGPQGVLPHVYTDHAAARSRAKDTAFRDFLDLFHHRLVSLFYRAWERHHPLVAAERGEEDRLRSHLLDLTGAGTEGVRRHSAVPADTLAFYAGLLAMRSRPAVGLAQIIADAFRVPVTVEQFVGEWRALRSGGQVCLDDDGLDGQLGAAVIGNAVYDPQARVRVRIGPLARAQFDAFLPGGALHASLRALARHYVDEQIGVEAQLVLAREDVPATSLGDARAPALGLGTWLRSKPPVHDADDVRLALC